MNGSPDDSTVRTLHRLVEHYTPDGTFGRGLLGGTALFSAPVAFLAGATMLAGATSFPVFVAGSVAFGVSVPAFVVGLVVLWPVYLSLVGNVESPSAYPEGATRPRATAGDPTATLKRRYAAGELSREEFERRLDGAMGPPPNGGASGTDERSETTDRRSESADDADRARTRYERSRNG